MKLYKHNFIGQNNANVVQNWSGTDDEEMLIANLKKMPNDWYYRTNKVTYDFNSLGHRSKEIASLDIDNYILFTGCSFTEGVGVELSKTYASIVSRELKCDYYNLGLGGSGVDTLLHNLIIWRAMVSKLPKVLVIQWPERSRYLISSTADLKMVSPRGPWYNDPITEQFILAGEDSNFFRTRRLLTYKLIETLFACKIVQVTVNKYTEGTIFLPASDLARDNLHPGIESNINFANTICKEILSKS